MGLAIDLALQGIETVVLERSTTLHRIPKGQNLTQRTGEHFRRWNISEAVRAASPIPASFGNAGMVAYGRLRGEAWYLVQALELLRGLPAEDNSIIRRWQAWGRPVRNALESQGCLELHKTLCRQHQEACGQPMPSERVPALAA